MVAYVLLLPTTSVNCDDDLKLDKDFLKDGQIPAQWNRLYVCVDGKRTRNENLNVILSCSLITSLFIALLKRIDRNDN